MKMFFIKNLKTAQQFRDIIAKVSPAEDYPAPPSPRLVTHVPISGLSGLPQLFSTPFTR